MTQTMRHKVAASLPPALATTIKNTLRISRHPVILTTIGEIFRPGIAEQPDTPWWNKRAIRYLDQYLRPGDRVFEWGSGGSTVWLTRLGVSVTSIEHDPEWVEKVIDRCPAANVECISGVTEGDVRAEPYQRDGFKLDEKGQYFFDDYVAAIDRFETGSFDVVIVDGLCRLECVCQAAPKVKPGGLLVVDDTDYWDVDTEKILPGWGAISFWGFKRTRDLRRTTFFRKPR